MDRYAVTKQLGDGTYGSVLLATANTTGEKVAIKKMKKKYYKWEECLNLREVKSLRKLKHTNVVQLKEVIRENDQLYFVFEFMKENLYQMMKSREKLFPEAAVRNIVYQVLQGLSYMHKHGYFHRDMKPENLLCNGTELVKIADFGLAREIRSRPPYTDYVSTRWYRAPEILLRSTNYNSPIDQWALGCIMAELYTLRPIFPGTSEIDEIFKICSVLGTPSKADWPEGHQLAAAMKFKWPQCVPTNLKSILPNAGSDALAVIRDLLSWDPKKRPGAAAALKYPYFLVGQDLIVGPPALSGRARGSIGGGSIHQPHVPLHRPTEYTGKMAQKPGVQDSGRYIQSPNSVKALPSLSSKQPGPGPGPPPNTFPSKSGRKRWGASEVWDDWDEFDMSASINKKKQSLNSEQTKMDEEPLTFGRGRRKASMARDDDDIFSFNPKPKKVPTSRRDSENMDPFWFGEKVTQRPNRVSSGQSSASSAKQIYISKSRYLPGINTKTNSINKESNSPSSKWSGKTTDLQRSQKPSNHSLGNKGSVAPPGGAGVGGGGGGVGGYMPSFGGNNVNKTNYNSPGWRGQAPANERSMRRQPSIGGPNPQNTGRTDWAAKYLKS